MSNRTLPASLTLLLASAACSAAPAFLNLGNLGSLETLTQPMAVCPDGTVVVGFTSTRAFRWSNLGAIQDLGFLPGGSASAVAYSANTNGTVLTGFSHSIPGFRAYRWQGDATGGFMTDLGVLPGGALSEGSAISADGNTIAGYSHTPAGNRAFRWTSGGGMVNLGILVGGTASVAKAISADGNTIAGFADSAGVQRAFRWTSISGMQDIGTLAVGQPSTAWDISADGSTIVGTSNFTAFTWDSVGGIQSLGWLPGAFSSEARAVNGDGSIVVGSSGSNAFAWSQATGLVNLQTHLPTLGISLSGWTITRAYGISDDGTVIAGVGTFNGQQRGWMVTGFSFTPPPSPCPGDVTGDGQVDLNDLNMVLFNFGNVCP